VSQIGGGCIPSALPRRDPCGNNSIDNLIVDCVVEDETREADGRTTISQIPSCDTGAKPCWRLTKKEQCGGSSPDGVGVDIDRGGAPAPDNTEARVACATLTEPQTCKNQ